MTKKVDREASALLRDMRLTGKQTPEEYIIDIGGRAERADFEEAFFNDMEESGIIEKLKDLYIFNRERMHHSHCNCEDDEMNAAVMQDLHRTADKVAEALPSTFLAAFEGLCEQFELELIAEKRNAHLSRKDARELRDNYAARAWGSLGQGAELRGREAESSEARDERMMHYKSEFVAATKEAVREFRKKTRRLKPTNKEIACTSKLYEKYYLNSRPVRFSRDLKGFGMKLEDFL